MQCTIWLNVCVCLRQRVCVCEQIAESSYVSQAPLLMPQPPSSLPFLPSFPLLFHLASLSFTFPALTETPLVSSSSLCLLPLWCRWLNWPMSWIHRLSIHSVCLPPSMYPSLPPLSVCWLYQAFCSSAQQQSPEQAGAFHFAHRQRGVGLSRQQENECLSPWGALSSPFSPLNLVSLALSLSPSLALSLSSNCLITTSCISGQRRTDLPCSSPPLLSIWHPPLLFSKKNPIPLLPFSQAGCWCLCVCVSLLPPSRPSLFFSPSLRADGSASTWVNSSQRGSQRVLSWWGSVSIARSDLNISVWVCGCTCAHL